MKKIISQYLSYYLIILSCQFSPALAQSWIPLCDGESLSGWVQRGGKATFIIENGTIVGFAKTNTENSFLCTQKGYDDFILEFEFFIDDALNSGVQFRSHDSWFYKSGRVYGNQFEIDPSERAWTGGIYDESRRGWIYPLSENPPAQDAFRNNQWNKARIEAIGPRIRTWVNGVSCADLIDSVDTHGYIALQVHNIGKDTNKEGKTVRWRNIRICTDDIEHYLMPEEQRTPQVYAKAPKYSIKDVVSVRILISCLLALLCLSMIAVCVMRKKNHKIL